MMAEFPGITFSDDAMFSRAINPTRLNGHKFTGCEFVNLKTSLQGADLHGATYQDCSFKKCDLTGANVVAVDFDGSISFNGCTLDKANFKDAKCNGVLIPDADLIGQASSACGTTLPSGDVHRCGKMNP